MTSICASGCLLMFLMGQQHIEFVFAGTFLITALIFHTITIDNHTSEHNTQILKQRAPTTATQELIDMIRNEK